MMEVTHVETTLFFAVSHNLFLPSPHDLIFFYLFSSICFCIMEKAQINYKVQKGEAMSLYNCRSRCLMLCIC